jgi:predicted dehydrogenase
MLRIGVLGTGYWAGKTHAAAIAAHPNAELVGVWGRDPGKAAAVAGRHGARAFADLDDLLDAVDAVSVAVPPDVQAELAVRAAGAGRHLLLDKPLALSLDGARRVADAAAAAGVASLVFFTARFFPEVAAWLDGLRRTGDWQGGHGAWLASIDEPGNPYRDSAWRRAHGALWDVGPHALGLILPALGAVERVTAAGGPGDTVHLALGHRGGGSSTLSLSLTVPPAAATMALEVYGPSGRSAMPRGDASAVAAFGEAIGQLARSVATGTPHPCDVGFGRDVVAVLDATQRSLAAGGRTTTIAG